MKSKRLALIDAFPTRDLIAFIALFFLIMVFIFPGWNLKDLLSKGEKTNLRLYVKYLEALTTIHTSPQLLEALANGYADLGMEEKALEVIESLKAYPNTEDKALKVKYRILKRRFFSTQDPQERDRIHGDLGRTLRAIMLKTNDQRTLSWIYEESISMDLQEVALETALKLANLTQDPKWKEEALRKAFSLGKYQEALRIGESIENKDSYILLTLFRSAVALKDYEKAKKYLTLFLERNPSQIREYARDLIWLTVKSGQNPRPTLIRLVESTKDPTLKKELIKLSIEYALGRKDYQFAKYLIDKYATDFVGDKGFTKFLLRSALATGDPEFAGEVAEKIAKAMGVVNGKDN
ncbi:MAG: hypothetical protein GXO18_07565 [Aquificae bacterium]|nr:hypothetical protein [Aquificota bacterium]